MGWGISDWGSAEGLSILLMVACQSSLSVWNKQRECIVKTCQ
jgi:hypothetical protein